MAANWRAYWDRDTPLYVSARHRALHYSRLAAEIAALIPSPDAHVLDHACGEALDADRVARGCARLVLLDGAPLVRGRLATRHGGDPRVAILAPEDLPALPDGTLDLVVANSLAQYLALDELRALLRLWRAKLKATGLLVLADVIPAGAGALDDARALLAFAARGGFLAAALVGLARAALSDYRRLRGELGLARYGEAEMIAILRAEGFAGHRAARNLGHDQGRMAFHARPD